MAFFLQTVSQFSLFKESKKWFQEQVLKPADAKKEK